MQNICSTIFIGLADKKGAKEVSQVRSRNKLSVDPSICYLANIIKISWNFIMSETQLWTPNVEISFAKTKYTE